MQRLENHILDALFFVSIAIFVAQLTLSSVPELFSGGAAIGTVLLGLSMSYVGAWIFHLIVLRLPAARDKKAVISVLGNSVAQYAGVARGLLQEISLSVGLPPPPRRPDGNLLKRVFSAVNPNSDAPMARGLKLPIEHLNWIEYMGVRVRESNGLVTEMGPMYPYLDARTISAISKVKSTSFARLMTTQDYLFIRPSKNRTLDAFYDAFLAYWTACSELGDRYIEEIYPLLDEQKRLEIDADNEAADTAPTTTT